MVVDMVHAAEDHEALIRCDALLLQMVGALEVEDVPAEDRLRMLGALLTRMDEIMPERVKKSRQIRR